MLDPQRTTIVSGCPGAGKTTTLLGMVDDDLAAGTPPDRIGYLTFAKAAQQEAIERAAEKFAVDKRSLPYFQTIHSLGFRQCGMNAKQVLGRPHMDALSRYLNMALSGITAYEGAMESKRLGDRLMHHTNLARVRCVPLRQHYEESNEDFGWSELERFERGLSTFKVANDLYDFTDMLSLFLEEGAAPQLDVVFVDEAQDLSQLQWRAIAKVARHARKVVIAGDDDQAIFEWAGADVRTFIGQGGTVVPLTQSYRVPRSVQRVAAGVVGRIRHRREKEWRARQAEGAVIGQMSIDHVDMSEGEWLVLARNKVFLKRVEGALRHEGLVYEFLGSSSIPHIRAIELWENLRNGGILSRAEAIEVYESMRAGRGYKQGGKANLIRAPEHTTVNMDDLRGAGRLMVEGPWYEALDRIPLEERTYIRAARRRGESLQAKPRIRLSTIHAAKGQEAENVALMTDVSPITYRRAQENPDAEARVFYVGATRAKERLHIIKNRGPRAYAL